MRFLLQMGLLSGLLYGASGCCCCADYCGSGYGGNGYGGNGYGATGAGYQQNYSTVATGGYQATGQTAGMTTGGFTNQSSSQVAQNSAFSSSDGNCPCQNTNIPAGTFPQDANGMPMQGMTMEGMPMQGMVYDASVVPTPVEATPANATGTQIPKRRQNTQSSVPQPQIGIPVGTDGQPLVPPSTE